MNNHTSRTRILIAVCLCVLVAVSAFGFLNSRRNVKELKFSIDDATLIFEDIHRRGYESIFESLYLSKLKDMHDQYGLDVTLFVFERTGSYAIEDFPSSYKKEFEANSDWLKIGWHGVDENNPQSVGYHYDELVASYDNVTEQIIRFAGKGTVSKELRLHFWYSDGEEFAKYLADQGVKGLYYPDTDVVGYDFSSEDDAAIRRGTGDYLKKTYSGKPIKYQVTDIRLDNLQSEEELEGLLNEHLGEKTIVVFTHAWLLTDTEKYLDCMCKWAQDNGYKMDWN